MRENRKAPKGWMVAATVTRAIYMATFAAIVVRQAEAQPPTGRGTGPRPFTRQDSAESPIPSDSFNMRIARDSILRAGVVERMTAVGAHLGHLPFEIPEYHDEQQLPDGAGGLGPMAYVFASPYLGGFTHVNQFNAHGPYGAFVAVLWIATPAGGVIPTSYSSLNLVAGMNCVYLAHMGGSPVTNWRAFIVPGSEQTGCTRPGAASPVLTVHATQGGGANARPGDYPAVARFDEDAAGKPLIGVACALAWCQIGPTGMAPKRPSHSADPNLGNSREGRVQGWHDDQLLSVMSAAGVLQPQVRATVTPVRDLHTKSISEFTNRWVTVATIWLQNDPTGTKYATRWGMRQGRNRLELAYAFGRWHGRISAESAPNSFTWLIVRQHKHLDMVVPGTARFRWRVFDESVWIPCDQGCCRVDAVF